MSESAVSGPSSPEPLVVIRSRRVAGTPLQRRVVLADFYWTRDKDPRVALGHASMLTELRAATTADVRSVVLRSIASRD